MQTLGLKNINMLSKEQYEEIESPFSNELYAISGSGFGFPSNSYIDLELGATGTRYTAPANGWFMFGKTSTGTGQRLALFNKGLDGATKNGIALYAHASGDVLFAYMPVIKGEVMETVYTMAGTTNYFRFIYAEGEE